MIKTVFFPLNINKEEIIETIKEDSSLSELLISFQSRSTIPYRWRNIYPDSVRDNGQGDNTVTQFFVFSDMQLVAAPNFINHLYIKRTAKKNTSTISFKHSTSTHYERLKSLVGNTKVLATYYDTYNNVFTENCNKEIILLDERPPIPAITKSWYSFDVSNTCDTRLVMGSAGVDGGTISITSSQDYVDTEDEIICQEVFSTRMIENNVVQLFYDSSENALFNTSLAAIQETAQEFANIRDQTSLVTQSILNLTNVLSDNNSDILQGFISSLETLNTMFSSTNINHNQNGEE